MRVTAGPSDIRRRVLSSTLSSTRLDEQRRHWWRVVAVLSKGSVIFVMRRHGATHKGSSVWGRPRPTACRVRGCAFDNPAIAPCHKVDIGAVGPVQLIQLRAQCFDQPPVVVRGSSSLAAGQFLRLLLRCHGDGAADKTEVLNIGFSPGRVTTEDRADAMVEWGSTRH